MRYCKIVLTLLALLTAACGSDTPPSDAFGNFEADQTTISSEAAGKLVAFDVHEGMFLPEGEVAAVVDTVQVVLERDALRAQQHAVRSRIDGVRAQLDVLETRREIMERERARVARLVRQDAAPAKQLDDIDDQLRILDREAAATRSQIGTIEREADAVEARLAQIAERLQRHVIVNPFGGTVITAFAEPHELASPGRPLYTIARLDTLVLKAFVSGGQLPDVRLGMQVDVVVDGPNGTLRTLPGRVVHVASEAEFTPRLIQTREERVDLVYAVDVRVPNPEGMLKIGMPGEIQLPSSGALETEE